MRDTHAVCLETEHLALLPGTNFQVQRKDGQMSHRDHSCPSEGSCPRSLSAATLQVERGLLRGAAVLQSWHTVHMFSLCRPAAQPEAFGGGGGGAGGVL